MPVRHSFLHIVAAVWLLAVVSIPTSGQETCEIGPAPEDADAWTTRGDCLRESGHPGDAVDAYEEALRLEPAGFRALFYGLGLALEDLDQGSRALEAFQRARAQGGADADLLYHIGIAHEISGDYDPALESFHQAIALRPDDGRAQRNIGFVLINQGNPEDAIPFLRRAIDLDANDHKAWVNLGLAYMDVEDDIRRRLRAISFPQGPVDPDDPKLRLRKTLVEKLHGFDWFGEAVTALRESVNLKPSEPVYWYNLGTAYSERRRHAEAIEALSRAADLDPGYYAALRNLTLAQERLERYHEAYETSLRIAALPEGQGDLWLQVQLADLERLLGELESAEARYVAVLQADPDDVNAHIGLAIVYRRQGRTSDSDAHLQSGIELRPDLRRVFEHAVEQVD